MLQVDLVVGYVCILERATLEEKEDDVDVVQSTFKEEVNSTQEDQTKGLLVVVNSFQVRADVEESVSTSSLAAFEVSFTSDRPEQPSTHDIFPKIRAISMVVLTMNSLN